jgi:hypothetical protein
MRVPYGYIPYEGATSKPIAGGLPGYALTITFTTKPKDLQCP